MQVRGVKPNKYIARLNMIALINVDFCNNTTVRMLYNLSILINLDTATRYNGSRYPRFPKWPYDLTSGLVIFMLYSSVLASAGGWIDGSPYGCAF